MSKLQELHQLVHAMGKSEKRAFRLSVAAFSQSQPIQLFDQLVRSKVFEKDKLENVLKDHGLLKSLPTLMARLRKLILRSIEGTQTNTSVDSQLRMALAEIEILFQKKLLDQALYRINKSRNLARQYSRFAQELQLISWERRLLFEQQPNQVEQAYQNLKIEELKTMESLRLLQETSDIQNRMSSLSREITNPREPREIQRFNDLYQNPVLRQGLESSDFLTYAYSQHCIGLYHIALKNVEEACTAYTLLMERWMASPKWINEQSNFFLASFNNYQISLLFSPKTELSSIHKYTNFFAQHRFGKPKVKFRFQQINYGGELLIFLNKAAFQEAQPLCNSIRSWLQNNQTSFPKSTWLYFNHNLAVFHFLAGQPSLANQHVQAILNFPDGEQRRDIRDFAEVFQLILHSELDNRDLVEYLYRSVKRHFSIEGTQNALINALIEFFNWKKGERIADKQEALQKAISAISSPSLGLEETSIWVRSKIEGKSISDVFRERLTAS